ncbi:MAG TPA: RNA-binding S4 domain-containing protein [Bacteroidales bacterium]|nr:RNA-binding S4 domain-containing protein [Bacteroidales bacterium]HQI46102.1 RNA-binding S4 domain-containing protein [Bacteroidales bacterium]
MKEFKLGEQEFIPLNTLLKLLNFVQSGGEANHLIDEGIVKVNEVIEKQKRKKLRVGDKVTFQNHVVLITKS